MNWAQRNLTNVLCVRFKDNGLVLNRGSIVVVNALIFLCGQNNKSSREITDCDCGVHPDPRLRTQELQMGKPQPENLNFVSLNQTESKVKVDTGE